MTQSGIEAFLAICQFRNISRAAQALFITQSSLSTRLKTLEQELGCQLIRRQKGMHTVTLTVEGERFYRLALQYQRTVQQMLAVGGRGAREVLRVASSNSVGAYLLPPVYERFLSQVPQVQLQIQEWVETGAELGADQAADLAFSVLDAPISGLSAIPILSEEMIFLCAAGADYPETVPLDALRVEDEVHIAWSTDFTLWHENTFSHALPPITLETMEQLRFFLSQRQNWAVVPASVAAGIASGIQVQRRKMAAPPPRRVVYLFSTPATLERPCAAQFLDCLRASLRGREGEGIELLI